MDVQILNQSGDKVSAEVNVFVTLSERNLRDLLAQFEDTRYVGVAPTADLHRRCGDRMLHIQVTGDAAHYADREPGRGSGLMDE